MKKAFIIAILAAAGVACESNDANDNDKDRRQATVNTEEQHRPHYHFTPEAGWMNDPNGMFYYDGEYHLFYQYNPDSTVWGPMHWGHAISEDLVHWEHMPIALYPDEHGTIFSGSAVVDEENTSGLGADGETPLVAIFTYHNAEAEEAGKDDFQTQGIAYSVDNGRNWTKYENNPVLDNPGIKDFRDPKVMWHEDSEKWVMSLAVADKISFYSSQNLLDWQHESDFGQDTGAHGGVWECPDLFPLKVDGESQEKWVLLVSINPGAPNGGSGTQYFVGDFDGSTFTMDGDFAKDVGDAGIWIDYGRDNYAGVTFANVPDNRRIFMGWMSNWSYANVVPTENWRSAMTVARDLSLVNTDAGIRLISQPVDALEELYDDAHDIESQTIADGVLVGEEVDLGNGTFLLKLALEVENDVTDYTITFSNAKGQELLIGFDSASKQYFTDRTNAGDHAFSEDFGARHTAPRFTEDKVHQLQMLIDVASLELFADEGKTSMTDIFFPDEVFSKVKITGNGGNLTLKSGTLQTINADK